jgi:multidrug efflux pump subunit AcrB
MSNETRTMLVVLLVCGLLMCGCIVLPIGVGTMFFLTASRQADMARVQVQRALAAEQQARAQAELARAQAQNAQVQTMAPSADPDSPPIPALPGVFPPGLVAPNLDDVEQRKQLYTAFKDLRKADEELTKVGTEDPTVALIASAVKQQKDALLKGAGLTQEQIDQILAEGDKAGW